MPSPGFRLEPAAGAGRRARPMRAATGAAPTVSGGEGTGPREGTGPSPTGKRRILLTQSQSRLLTPVAMLPVSPRQRLASPAVAGS